MLAPRVKRVRRSFDPVNGFLAAVFVAAVLVGILVASHAVQVVAFIVAFVAVAAIFLGLLDLSQAGQGQTGLGRLGWRRIPIQSSSKADAADPLRQALHDVDSNPAASADDWAREQAAYAEKARRGTEPQR